MDRQKYVWDHFESKDLCNQFCKGHIPFGETRKDRIQKHPSQNESQNAPDKIYYKDTPKNFQGSLWISMADVLSNQSSPTISNASCRNRRQSADAVWNAQRTHSLGAVVHANRVDDHFACTEGEFFGDNRKGNGNDFFDDVVL